MKHHLVLGVILSLVGSLFYATQAAIVKSEAIGFPLSMILFIQSATGLLLLLPFLLKNGVHAVAKKLKTQQLRWHFLRACASVGINFLLFSSVKYISLVNAMLLANTVPLIVPFIAYVFLGYKINHRLWLPIIIGFVGVAIVLKPDAHIFNPASFLALGAAVCMSITLIIVRKLSTTDTTEAIAFYVFLFSALLTGCFAFLQWVPLTVHSSLVFLSIGLMYFLIQAFLTAALQRANPQLVSTLLYSSIIFAVFIDIEVWRIYPTTGMVMGMLLAVLGGVLCIRLEYKSSQLKKIMPHPQRG